MPSPPAVAASVGVEERAQWQALCVELLAIVDARGDSMLDALNEASKRALAALSTPSAARDSGLEEAAKVAEQHIEHDGIAVVELSTCFADARSKTARKIAAAVRALQSNGFGA